ncbi:hypothetical protein D9M69_387000 [compost metagenome]
MDHHQRNAIQVCCNLRADIWNELKLFCASLDQFIEAVILHSQGSCCTVTDFRDANSTQYFIERLSLSPFNTGLDLVGHGFTETSPHEVFFREMEQ